MCNKYVAYHPSLIGIAPFIVISPENTTKSQDFGGVFFAFSTPNLHQYTQIYTKFLGIFGTFWSVSERLKTRENPLK